MAPRARQGLLRGGTPVQGGPGSLGSGLAHLLTVCKGEAIIGELGFHVLTFSHFGIKQEAAQLAHRLPVCMNGAWRERSATVSQMNTDDDT